MNSVDSGCFGLSSSSLAVVVPSATEELNSGCNSNSGSVKSTCWLTNGACHGAGHVPTGSLLDLRLLSAFKPPAYEDVVHHPGTPPPPYTMAPGPPLTTCNECTRCSSESNCSAHLEVTNVEGVSSHQSALPHQEGEPRAGLSPVHIPPSCRYRRLTGDSGIELCPCPDSSEGEPVKEVRVSATQPDLEDHSPWALPPDSMSQVPPIGLASSYGDIP